MKKIQMNYATPVIETGYTSTPFPWVFASPEIVGQVCADRQRTAIRKFFACQGDDMGPFVEWPKSSLLPLMFKRMSLSALLKGCLVEACPHLSPEPTTSELRQMLEAFGRLNAQIWPHEQTLEPETEQNRPWRKLGEAMHWLYEAIKYENMLAGGEHWDDPTFFPIFHEAWRRADAGEPMAVAVMREKWGIMF
jgi:hypothetical protein